MLRSALAAVLPFAILLLFGAPAVAHSLARPDTFVPRHTAEFVAAPLSQTHDGSPCCPDGTHVPLCCTAGACFLAGCLATAEPAFFPAVPGTADYALFEGSRPDGAGIAPDLPPPRAIV